MAKGINKVTLLGNLGKDPEVHASNTGSSVVTLSLATSNSYQDKAGQWIEQTEWHHVTLFKRLAEIASEYLKKGAKVYIEGKLQSQKYKDKEGKDRTKLAIIANELQMLSSKTNGDPSTPIDTNQNQATQQEGLNDDIPF